MLSLLLGVIALTPTLLSGFLFNLYGKTKFTKAFFAAMLCITIWQIDDAMMYMNIPEHTVMVMVKLFRAGQIAAIPTLILCLYMFFDQHKSRRIEGAFSKLHRAIFNLHFIKFAYLIAAVLYVVNWTPFDIQGLQRVTLTNATYDYYVPVYGVLSIGFKVFCSLYLLAAIVTYWGAFKISAPQTRVFILTFITNFTLIFMVAMVDFLPQARFIASSLVVLVTSIIGVFAFVKLFNNIKMDYEKEIERQERINSAGRMASSLMHEIKNSLTVIKGSADLLNMGETNPDLIKAIVMGSKQLNELVQSFHQFIKSDLNIEFNYDKVNDTINKAMILSKNFVNDAGAKVSFEADSKNTKAYINSTHLAQVIVNLLKNAVEAMPSDQEDKRVIINLSSDADHVIINVKDNGAGIPQEKWEKVFAGFYSSKENGMGLGLAYCRKVVTAHHGTIHIAESDSTGTHIQILLPHNKFQHLIAG